MTNESKKRVKQSFVAGSLTSSAGVFLTKVIGVFYVSPMNSLASAANMSFYTAAYSYYSVLLQVCSAGLPFAIAALIAKYVNKDDYKTVMLIRKLSFGILSVTGFFVAMLFSLSSGYLSKQVLGLEANAQDLISMRNTFIILSGALFVVPILYSYRSFYQGFKNMRLYANSQVIEQFVRVGFLLALGWVCVNLFHFDRIWVIYIAAVATSIGALAAIYYYVRYDRSHIGPIIRGARAQQTEAVDKKTLLMELFAFGIPYLITAVFGNSQVLINTHYFISTMTNLGMPYELSRDLYGIIQLKCDKLTSIPQVLGIGFSSGIVPYMTISLENKDFNELRKNIRDCLGTVLYIAVPVCFCLYALARPIYYLMYGAEYLNYAAISLKWESLLALCTTITPICSSMMMTLMLRKESIFYLFVGFVVKCISFYPLMKYTGYVGAITSSILCSAVIIYLCLAKISNKYDVDYRMTFRYFLKMLLCCICMNGAFAVMRLVGFSITENSRAIAMVQLVVYGLVGMGIYFYTSSLMKLPQNIFHVSFKELINRVLKK